MEENKKSSDNTDQISSGLANISGGTGQAFGGVVQVASGAFITVLDFLQQRWQKTFGQQTKTTFKNRRSPNVTTTEKHETAVNESPCILSPATLPSLNPKTLILVIYADQNIDISQENNRPLNQWIHEKFYEATQYLCIVEDSFFHSKENQIKNFIVPEGKERDDDIYLIKLHLKDNDDRFNPRVNQIDRIRAFRELSSLVDDLEILPRLRLEAGQLFNLYHR